MPPPTLNSEEPFLSPGDALTHPGRYRAAITTGPRTPTDAVRAEGPAAYTRACSCESESCIPHVGLLSRTWAWPPTLGIAG